VLAPSDRGGGSGLPSRGGGGDDDDDDAAPTRPGLAGIDDETGSGRRSVADAEAELLSEGDIKTSHFIAVSGAFDGATWLYAFDGNAGLSMPQVRANFYPGFSVRGDIWPLPFLGFDVHGALSAVQFEIKNGADLQIAPEKFVSYQTNAGLSARGRYTFRLGDDGVLRVIGVGGRLGYRFFGSSVETQTVSGGPILTVVPGFALHGLAVGPELYVPLFVADRRIEIELKLDGMPATFYNESPDNPGQSSLAFGYHAELLVRADLFGGFFFEAAARSTGANIAFEGQGDRVTVDPTQAALVPLQGGQATNLTAGFSVGLGFFY
jgi:hypothetical protein